MESAMISAEEVERRLRASVPGVEALEVEDVSDGHTSTAAALASGRSQLAGGREFRILIISAVFEGMALIDRHGDGATRHDRIGERPRPGNSLGGGWRWGWLGGRSRSWCKGRLCRLCLLGIHGRSMSLRRRHLAEATGANLGGRNLDPGATDLDHHHLKVERQDPPLEGAPVFQPDRGRALLGRHGRSQSKHKANQQ